jgi:sulfotransferase family protein
MSNPYVFIVGCPRSGTTLLRHMVDAHPQIAITPEAHWIPLWFEEGTGLTSGGMITPELIARLLDHPKFALFRLDREEVIALAGDGHSMSYAALVTAIHDLYGKIRSKAIVGNKTPDSARRMQTLHALWPEARFVHLIRDGRDVALSLMAWPRVTQKRPGTLPTWEEDPVSTAALWWELNVRRGRQDGKLLASGLYYELRYESLIANPGEECANLCAFLGLPYDDAMLRFYENRPRKRLSARSDWQPITSGLRNWRTQMPAENVERFEAVVGGLLDELVYPRAFPSVRPEVMEHSCKIRELLTQHSLWPARQ